MKERLFTPAEIAEAWKVSTRTVQDLFRNQPGVVRIGNQLPGRRRRTILRIPESVVERVQAERQVR